MYGLMVRRHRLVARLLTLGVRPPKAEADRAERLRFVRDLNLRCAAITAVVILALWFTGVSGPFMLLALVVLVTQVGDVAWLTFAVRRQA